MPWGEGTGTEPLQGREGAAARLPRARPCPPLPGEERGWGGGGTGGGGSGAGEASGGGEAPGGLRVGSAAV